MDKACSLGKSTPLLIEDGITSGAKSRLLKSILACPQYTTALLVSTDSCRVHTRSNLLRKNISLPPRATGPTELSTKGPVVVLIEP